MIAGLLVGLPLLMTPTTRADFAPFLSSGTGTGTTFIYSASFNNALNSAVNPPTGAPVQQLSPYSGNFTPTGTTGATLPGQFPVPAAAPGSFFTIYDIPNLSSAMVNLPNFRVATQTLGLTSQQPPGSPPNPTDSSTLTNVTVISTGPAINNPAGMLFSNLLTITTTTAPGGLNLNGVQTNQVGSDAGTTSLQPNTPITAQGPVTIPGAVPEPASVVMMSFGGLGVGALSLFLRRKASA